MNKAALPYDAHCHLNSLDVINQTQNLAVASIEPQDIVALSSLRNLHQNLKIGIGLHPWQIPENCNLLELENQLIELIEKYRPNFIGECGLDKLKPNYELQKQATILHCKLAQKYSLPIVFHCVRSYNELLEILTLYPIKKGLLHAYNANNETAKQLAKKNIYLGIGSLIMADTSQINKSIARIPIEQLLIESDAPYMPVSQKSNSSSQDCQLYLNKICQIKKISPTETVELINQNWINFYS